MKLLLDIDTMSLVPRGKNDEESNSGNHFRLRSPFHPFIGTPKRGKILLKCSKWTNWDPQQIKRKFFLVRFRFCFIEIKPPGSISTKNFVGVITIYPYRGYLKLPKMG